MAKNPQAFTNSVPEAVQAPIFNFSQYEQGATYVNNGSRIDFVTDGDELYVCVMESVTATAPTLKGQDGMLKLVSKGVDGSRGPIGAQGRPGHTPKISAKFENGQMVIYADGQIVAVTRDLTGPAWVPERQGDEIVWNCTTEGERPEPINLNDLRVKEKPLLLRTNSDNTKRSDELSGPANFIQWKYEGDADWTNLISISELMNLALAGISIWQNENGEYHLGHREVIKAKYSSSKTGRRIISDVELGDILFDAGEIVPGLELNIDEITLRLDAIEDEIDNLKLNIPDLSDYLTKAEAAETYQPIGEYLTEHQSLDGLVRKVNGQSPNANGEVTIDVGDVTGVVKSVKVNGTTHNPNDAGLVDLGNISGDTSNCVKSVTINGETKTPNASGNVSFTIAVGNNSLYDIKISNGFLYKKATSDSEWTEVGSVGGPGGLTETQVKSIVGRILEGLEVPSEYVRGADHNYFIRKSDLADYATMDWVRQQLIDITLNNDVDYYRVFTLYQRTNSGTTVPNRPVVGVWEWNANTDGIALKPNASSDWDNHPINATSNKPYLWMTSATYSYKTKREIGSSDSSISSGVYVYDENYAWSNPVCLTGENGQDGEDGKGIEFIFHLGATAPGIDYTTSKKGSTTTARTKAWWATEASEDWCPGDGSTGYWTDDPIGIDDTNADTKIEWARIRRSHFDTTNNTTVWEDFGDAFIWSMWGEDGIDGAGVEYIFCVTAQSSIGAFAAEIPLTQTDVDHLGAAYQVSDWLPNGGNGNWTDNPLDVDENQPYEWVAIRKYNGTTGLWGPFSEPKVWGLWGQKTINTIQVQDGTTYYKPYTCYAFTRTNTDLTGYSVDYTFASYASLTPEQKSAFYDNPLNFVKTLDTNNNLVNNITWYDTVPNTAGQLWLITNHIGDEGEQSETGWNGPIKWGDNAGFQIEYAISDSNTDAVYAGTKTLPSLNGYKDNSIETINETAWRTAAAAANCGTWSDTIANPVYMATAYKKGDGNWSAWTVAKIKGEKGDKGDTGPQGLNGSNGADGADIEFVYYRSDSESHVPAMSETYGTYDCEHKVSEDLYEDDFFPMAIVTGTPDNTVKIDNDTFWHDHPEGVTEEFPCEWIGIRHSSYQNGNKIWGNFNIALWSKYGARGRDGDGIEYVFWPLTDEEASYVVGDIYPTQKAINVNTNNGQNVNPSRPDVPYGRYITDSEYLPAIALNGTLIQAVDDNPGITTERPNVYASMRKYHDNGNGGAWGEFSPIKLWLIKPDTVIDTSCTVHYTNDMEAVIVDSNYSPKSSYLHYTTGVDMRHGVDLKRPDQICIGSETLMSTLTYDSSNLKYTGLYNPTSGNELVYKGITIKRMSFSYTERSLGFLSIDLILPTTGTSPFANDTTVTIPITFKTASNESPIYAGTGDIYLNPTLSDGPFEFVDNGIDPIIYKPSADSTNYSPTSLRFSIAQASRFYMSSTDVKRAIYTLRFDGSVGETIAVNNYWAQFEPSIIEPGTLRSNNNQIYLDVTIPNKPYKLQFVQHVSDDKHVMDEYAAVLIVDLTSQYIPATLTSGIECYVGETGDTQQDYELVSVVYPGAQGPAGPAGPQGPQGPQGDPGQTIVTYQYLDGKVVRLSNWTDEQLEYSDGSTAVNGVKYLDVVKYVNNDTTSYYKCVSNVTYTSANKPASPSSDSTHWTAYTPQSDAWFDTLLANSAYIENLTSKQVVITNSDSTVVGGMTSSSGVNDTVEGRTIGNVRIWAGETSNNGNLLDAAFTVTDHGVVTSQGTIDTDNDNTDDVGLRTVMDNGLINIDVKDLTSNNPTWVTRARFGYENGNIVLKFFNDLGNEMYDLGPAGITQSGYQVTMPESNGRQFYYTANKITVNASFVGLNYTKVYLYQYVDGSRKIVVGENSGGLEFYNPVTKQYSSSHSPYHGKWFASTNNFSAPVNDGFYIETGGNWTTVSGTIEEAMMLDYSTSGRQQDDGYFTGYVRFDVQDHSGNGTVTEWYGYDEK